MVTLICHQSRAIMSKNYNSSLQSITIYIYLPLAKFRIREKDPPIRVLKSFIIKEYMVIDDVMSGGSENFKVLNRNSLLIIQLCLNPAWFNLSLIYILSK